MAKKLRRKKSKAAATKRPRKLYTLSLYITGRTPRSAASLQNLRDICEEYLSGRFELRVIDIYQQPELARDAQIIAAPTLIKSLPPPFRRLVGDLSNRKQVLLHLGLQEEQAAHA